MITNHSIFGARQRPGFTLCEVVISLGLVSFGILAVVGIFTTARRLERGAREDLSASLMARQLETELRLPGSVANSEAEQKTRVEDNEGRILGQLIPLGSDGFGSSSQPLLIAFDGNGVALGSRDSSRYRAGLAGETQAQYLLAFWAIPSVSGALDVQLRVEVPARAAAENRRSYSYWFSIVPLL